MSSRENLRKTKKIEQALTCSITITIVLGTTSVVAYLSTGTTAYLLAVAFLDLRVLRAFVLLAVLVLRALRRTVLRDVLRAVLRADLRAVLRAVFLLLAIYPP